MAVETLVIRIVKKKDKYRINKILSVAPLRELMNKRLLSGIGCTRFELWPVLKKLIV